jgi:hypothetical protein
MEAHYPALASKSNDVEVEMASGPVHRCIDRE